MPNYTVTDPDSGRTVTLTGDSAPTEAELNDIFSRLPAAQTQQPQGPSTFQYLMSKDAPGGGNLDALGAIARLGGKVNDAVQNVAGNSAEALGRVGVPPPIAAIPGTVAGTLSEAIIPQTRFGAAMSLLPLVSRGLGAAGDALANAGKVGNKPGFVAQLSQGLARLRPAETQFYLEHPGEVMGAGTVNDATTAYKEALGGDLKTAGQDLAARLNKTMVRPGDFDSEIDRVGRIVAGTEADQAGNKVAMTPQDALNGIQSINKALRDKEFTKALSQDNAIRLSQLKEQLMDYIQGNGSPDLRQAATDLFKAHVKENFSSILPKNKYGSTDALRTWLTTERLLSGLGAIGGAGAIAEQSGYGQVAALGGALAGAGTALGAAAISPRMWAAGINNVYSLAQPATLAALGLIGRSGNNLASYYQSPRK